MPKNNVNTLEQQVNNLFNLYEGQEQLVNDMLSNNSKEWLSQTVISTFLRIISDKPELNSFTPYLYVNANSKINNVGTFLKDSDVLARLDRGEEVVVPFNYDNDIKHWLLVKISKKSKNEYHVDFYDSLSNKSNLIDSKKLLLQKLSDSLLTHNPQFTLSYSANNCFKQNNSYDCGVFTIIHAMLLLNGVTSIPKSEIDVSSFRNTILESLIAIKDNKKRVNAILELNSLLANNGLNIRVDPSKKSNDYTTKSFIARFFSGIVSVIRTVESIFNYVIKGFGFADKNIIQPESKTNSGTDNNSFNKKFSNSSDNGSNKNKVNRSSNFILNIFNSYLDGVKNLHIVNDSREFESKNKYNSKFKQ